MLDVVITDPATKRQAHIDNGTETHALVVATRPLKILSNLTSFFLNPDYGPDMNINALVSGTPLKIHNGTDDTLWTASSVQGNKFTFDSVDQNHTALGTKSIHSDSALVNDIMEINNGSPISLSSYSSLSCWIYVESDWNAGDSIAIYGWDSVGGVAVGTEVHLEDYFDWITFGVWHFFIVSLEDLGLSGQTIDSLRIEIISIEGKSPNYYIDDIQFEESGIPAKYTVKPELGTWLHVKNFTFSFAAPYTGLLADGTFQKLPYDSVLGIDVPNGLVYQRTQERKIQFSQNFKTLMDAMMIPQTNISASGSDGVNSWLTFTSENIEPLVLKAENDDELSFTISDNLSAFLHFRVAVGASVEQRS